MAFKKVSFPCKVGFSYLKIYLSKNLFLGGVLSAGDFTLISFTRKFASLAVWNNALRQGGESIWVLGV